MNKKSAQARETAEWQVAASLVFGWPEVKTAWSASGLHYTEIHNEQARTAVYAVEQLAASSDAPKDSDEFSLKIAEAMTGSGDGGIYEALATKYADIAFTGPEGFAANLGVLKRNLTTERVAELTRRLQAVDANSEEAAELRKQIAAAAAETPETTKPTTIPKITLLRDAEMCERHTPQPPPIIEGYLNRGEVALLAASSKAGKSWLLLQAAKCIGAGVPFLDCHTERGTCVFLNTEIAGAAWEERSRKQNEALCIEDPHVFHASTRGLGVTIHNVIPLLKEAITGAGLERVDLICVDPYYTLTAGLGENEAGDVAAVMLGFQRMAEELNAAIWITHHFTKGDASGKSQLDRASGSGVFARSVDNFYTMTEDAQGRMVFEATRRNGASPPPIEIAFDFPIWRKVGEVEAIIPKRRGRGSSYSVEAFVDAFPDAAAILTWRTLQECVGAKGSTFGNYLNRAMDEGVVEKCNGGYRLSGTYADEKRLQTADEEAANAI